MEKATANKLIARSADVLENFYKAICQVVLQLGKVLAKKVLAHDTDGALKVYSDLLNI